MIDSRQWPRRRAAEAPKRRDPRKLLSQVFFGLGLVFMFIVVGINLWFAYISWFVHPELTRRMLAWVYWPEILATVFLLAVAAFCFHVSKAA